MNESPEERAARLEREAAEVAAAAAASADTARSALHARLKSEAEHVRANDVKIHNQWRRIMRMAKVEQLRGQIEIVSQGHEREMDRRDAMIQVLDRDLDDCDEQHEHATRGHFRVRARWRAAHAARGGWRQRATEHGTPENGSHDTRTWYPTRLA